MVEIFFHFFTNNHMHRAFSFFRLISWKVSVSLFRWCLAEEWLPSAKLSFHLGREIFFPRSLFCFFFAKSPARVPTANVECGGEFRKCQQTVAMRDGKRKILCENYSKGSCTFLSKSVSVKTKLDVECENNFQMVRLHSRSLLFHQHNVAPERVPFAFSPVADFRGKQKTSAVIGDCTAIGWQCGLRQ